MLNEWSLNRIYYYYKHCTLIYTILMFLWDNVKDTYQIILIIVNCINPMDILAIQSPLACNSYFFVTHQININDLIH